MVMTVTAAARDDCSGCNRLAMAGGVKPFTSHELTTCRLRLQERCAANSQFKWSLHALVYIQLYSPSMVAQKATIYSNNIYTYNMAI